jgi:hypothetical protein
MADETSGRSLLRQLIVDESAGGPNQGLVALQTAELLRTSLLSRRGARGVPGAPGGTDVASGAATDGGAPAPGPAGAISTPATAPAGGNEIVGVEGAVGVLGSPGGSAAAVQAWVSAHHPFGRRLGLAVDLSLPLRAGSLSGPEGSARLHAALAGLALVARLAEPPSGMFVNAALGLGAARVTADGKTTAPLVATSASALTAVAYLRADAGFDVARWLRLGARGVAGTTLTDVSIRFAGNPAATWGRPFLAALALVELDWR